MSPILSHIICNMIGLPDISFMYSNQKSLTSTSTSTGGRLSYLYPYRYIIIVLYVLGLYLFSIYIVIFTNNLSKNSIFMKILS